MAVRVWSVMSDPLGLSIGTTNLVAARVGNQPVIAAFGADPVRPHRAGGRRAVRTHPAAGADRIRRTRRGPGAAGGRRRFVLSRRAAAGRGAGGDGRPAGGRRRRPDWRSPCRRTGTPRCGALRGALRTSPNLAPDGTPPRLISDAVAALTALNANPGLAARGVVALLDFGGGGTSITLADAASAFDRSARRCAIAEFSGDQIDQALLSHVLDGVADCRRGRSRQAPRRSVR